jgi:hypothetical protein
MGITSLSLDRINRYIKPHSKILIVGCQNLYNEENYWQIAHGYFESLGHQVISIDICGCNGSVICDLREKHPFKPDNDLVLQHGTVEHIDGELYIPFLNLHNACKLNGIMIHENPRTENWPFHGQHYFTMEFYNHLGYEVLELCEEPAMSNTTDGWNVCAVLRKTSDKFLSEKQFKKVYEQYVFAK